MPERGVEAELAARLEAGEEVVLATVVATGGEPPSRPGAKVLLDREGAIAGTLGCAEFDTAAREAALEALEAGRPLLRTFAHDLGSVDVHVEPYAAAPVLLVLGDTPVGRTLARWAPEVGFRTLLAPGDGPLPELGPGDLFAVHTDHDAPGLAAVVEALLRREPAARYVGLMGSRRHTGHHVDELERRGVPGELLARVQSPVGIDIGARSAPEIALSMLAGLVAARHGTDPRWLDS